MKDSGILGCGSIPSHWGTIPLKYVSLLDGKVDTSYIKPEDEVSFAPMECVRNDKRIPRTALKSKDNGTYSSFCDGDIAIAKVTPCFENGNICIMDSLENGYAFGSSELFSIRPTNIVRRFLFYCLQTPYFIDGGVATMTGVGGLKRVSSYYMKNAKIALPPFPEQSAIAAYLDTQCAKIDEIIAQAKASIEDYKQWKASIIYEAVTKGLNPNVEMKDSGIPWIGKIPAHWYIKVLFQLVSQVKNKNKNLSETNLLSLSYGKIKRKNIDDTDGLLPASFDGYNIIENNDIVLRLTDLQNDHTSLRVGRATERGIITSAYITVRPTNSRMSEYLYYLLHAFDIKKGFYGMGSGVRQGLNYDEIKMLKLPLPPLDEQSTIATYLDTQCAKIDDLIVEKQSLIDDLESYKKSLIYEVVTGKRYIR